MNIDWALAGKIVTVWIIISFVTAPYIGRFLRRRRIEQHRKHFRNVSQQVVLNRAMTEAAVRADLKENEYQQRLRRAEALGFVEEDQRAS